MISFLDVEAAPEYLRPDVIQANAVLASYHELSELLTEAVSDASMPLEQFGRMLAQQRLTFDEYRRRSEAIISHINHEAELIAERIKLPD